MAIKLKKVWKEKKWGKQITAYGTQSSVGEMKWTAAVLKETERERERENEYAFLFQLCHNLAVKQGRQGTESM